MAARMGRASSQVAPLRADVIILGLLSTPQHGYAEFAVPPFEAFMKCAIPELDVPPPRRRRTRPPR